MPAKTPAKKVVHGAIPAKAGTSAEKTLPKTAEAAKLKKASPKVTAIERGEPVKIAKKIVSEKPAEAKLGNYFYANGKRKTSIASVRLFPNGKGTITVNKRTFENYFPVFTDQDKILAPLRMTNAAKLFDISVYVSGGGIHSQAEAVRHGVSKALLLHDANFRTILKPHGFLTRDARVKERKKYGLHRARRAPQFSKR